MEELTAIAGLASALAALGALIFAYLTVRQATQARKEENMARRLRNLQRVAELAGEVGDAMLRGLQGSNLHLDIIFPIAQARLRAALVAVPDKLPACRLLTGADRSSWTLSPRLRMRS